MKSLSWLYTLSFLESIFFPIPIDPLLALHCASKREQAYTIAAITTLLSVAGGLAAYGIGALLWEHVGPSMFTWFITQAQFDWARSLFSSHERLAILTVGFTPLPYKAITLAAGFCHLALRPFILFSLVGRGARFFLVALVMRTWGDQMRLFIDRFFVHLLVFASVASVLVMWILK